MNSNKSLQRPPDPHTFQFLPRSLKVSSKTNAFRNCRVKGFYLKKLLWYSEEEDCFDCNDYESVSQVFRNKKIHKTLTHVEVCSSLKPYVHYRLTTLKSLKAYALEFYGNVTNTIPFAIRKLPAKIQSIHLKIYLNVPMKKEEIYDTARSIRRFPKLQSFQRKFVDHTDQNKGCYIQKELAIYSKSVARLKEIKRMNYCFSDPEYDGLQRAMRRGFVYRRITGLKLSFWQDLNLDVNNEYLSLNFENMTPKEQEIYKTVKDDIKEKDQAENDDIDWTLKTLPHIKGQEDFDPSEKIDLEEERIDPRFIAFCRVTEEMRHFYRFELFPDLKRLSLTFSTSGYTFGPFVIDGFRALMNLENLKVTLHKRPKGMTFLFTALLELPLLKKFFLEIQDLNNEEWLLLGRFTERQNKIEEFHFGIVSASPFRTSYLQQNASLKRTLPYLGSNFSLKSLHLNFPFASLESLSQGLSHLKMMNQLHTFKFKACDDILTSQENPLKRVEGLCLFIKNQKKSLRTLHVDLPLALEEILVTEIAEVISQLSQLRELNFQCNFDLRNKQAFDYYQKTLQKKISPELQKEIALPEKWAPSLAKSFKRLANLEKLKLYFDIIGTEKMNPAGWLADVVSILPDFEKLKTLEIAIIFEHGSLRQEKQMFANQFLCLPRLKNIAVELYDFGDKLLPRERNLERIIEEINQRQARKNDFMFY